MHKRDSLLQLFVKWGIADDFPRLAERLATEDVTIPNLRRTIQLAEILNADREKKKIPEIPQPDEKPTGNSDERAFVTLAGKVAPTGLPSKSSLLRNPRQYLKNKYKENVKQSLPEPPEVIRSKYEGLTDIESMFAYSQLALSAKVVGKDYHPEIEAWLGELSENGNVPEPRVVIIDSDLPVAASLMLPDEKPAVIISTNLMEILNDRQLKAVIGHESLHVQEHGTRGVGSTILHNLYVYINNNEPDIREEFRADAFSATLTGSADDVVDALVAMQGRQNEIVRFAKQMDAAFDDQHILRGWLAPRFHELLRFAHASFRIMPESDPKQYRRNNRMDAHPPMMSRFDKLYDSDIA